MTDPTLTLALVVSVGLAIVFFVRMRNAEQRADRWRREYDRTFDTLEATELALHAKVAAETRGGDPEGPVAA